MQPDTQLTARLICYHPYTFVPDEVNPVMLTSDDITFVTGSSGWSYSLLPVVSQLFDTTDSEPWLYILLYNTTIVTGVAIGKHVSTMLCITSNEDFLVIMLSCDLFIDMGISEMGVHGWSTSISISYLTKSNDWIRIAKPGTNTSTQVNLSLEYHEVISYLHSYKTLKRRN